MAAPNPRVPVKPARGYYAVVLNDLASIQEGELFYIKDQNTLYVKEGGAAVPIVGAGSPVTNSVQAGDNITKLVNNAGYITAAQVPADRVQSVNGQVGIVVVSADDVPTTGTTNKFVTQQDLNKLAGIEAGAQVNTVNEAPLDGNFYVRSSGAWVKLTDALSALGVTFSDPVDAGNFTTGLGSALSNAIYDGSNFTDGTSGATNTNTIDGGLTTP